MAVIKPIDCSTGDNNALNPTGKDARRDGYVLVAARVVKCKNGGIAITCLFGIAGHYTIKFIDVQTRDVSATWAVADIVSSVRKGRTIATAG